MPTELRGVTFAYPDGTEALRDVSLSIEAGERIALVGRNGSGKSTLARHLNGLLRPSSGEVLFDGEPAADLSVAELAGKAALLFQNPDDQICKGRVADEVAFGPRNLGFSPARTAKLVAESLALFGLDGREEANPYDLGLSERKRLALASVAAMDTPLLVLDEPTAGLDAFEAGLLASALDGLSGQGRAVLLISHDMDFVAENCERAVSLESGRLRFDGPVTELFTRDDLLASCGLLPCQVARLSACFKLRPDRFTPGAFLASLRSGRAGTGRG
ncbi:Energy-coupling factor transporter ATP-binding protein EcfA2 [Pseudodesulfovibrio hydrargyri]|uniref:Energy-coupling factor transporter ATP-binding protein EcfA2 n=1 Tax=Pseudodesulfovibrio hydrargyri TaxID=2125990 RepID=A0A1J5N298_9BACT|nr:ABC transporter ATP-binding protein [Pseudodesulfovibrio hydrargyri]OIQ52244.1 Energy-coupling factor transporter ATP-binding protein EcfA2 [Pseudodesulfovibrio hydrargyri]